VITAHDIKRNSYQTLHLTLEFAAGKFKLQQYYPLIAKTLLISKESKAFSPDSILFLLLPFPCNDRNARIHGGEASVPGIAGRKPTRAEPASNGFCVYVFLPWTFFVSELPFTYTSSCFLE
jgi:hypothetical protein